MCVSVGVRVGVGFAEETNENDVMQLDSAFCFEAIPLCFPAEVCSEAVEMSVP